MLNTYNILKSIHILAAATWVGSGLLSNVLLARIVRSDDTAHTIGFVRDLQWVGKRVFMPTSVVVLVFGVLGVLDGPYDFSEPWIGIGILGVLVSSLTGALLISPELERIADLSSTRGIADPEVNRRIGKVLTLGRVDLAILAIVVVVMVIKPG